MAVEGVAVEDAAEAVDVVVEAVDGLFMPWKTMKKPLWLMIPRMALRETSAGRRHRGQVCFGRTIMSTRLT